MLTIPYRTEFSEANPYNDHNPDTLTSKIGIGTFAIILRVGLTAFLFSCCKNSPYFPPCDVQQQQFWILDPRSKVIDQGSILSFAMFILSSAMKSTPFSLSFTVRTFFSFVIHCKWLGLILRLLTIFLRHRTIFMSTARTLNIFIMF